MKIYDTFSARVAKSLRTARAEVYQYDDIPQKVANQAWIILNEAIGRYRDTEYYENADVYWDHLAATLGREWGDLSLLGGNSREKLRRCLLDSGDFLPRMDILEMALKMIDRIMRNLDDHERKKIGSALKADDAITEMNYRLREGGVGYQFVGGQIVRMDNEYLHSEVVVGSLQLLSADGFAGPDEEFRLAHKHFRSGENKEAILAAGKSFESAMKAICEKLNWSFDKNARASDLIKVLRDNNLFPQYLDKSFDQLLATLASGLPEVRNKEGGHGQGATLVFTPSYVAAYALHLAATKIVFLVECMKDRASRA